MTLMFMLVLLVTGFSGSVFMVLESSSYFASLYAGEYALKLGLFSAVLAEAFQHIFVMSRIEMDNPSKEKRINLLIKTLAALIFLSTVIAASQSVVKPLFERLETISEAEMKAEQLKRILKNREQDLDVFSDQKTNAAISAQKRREVEDRLMDTKIVVDDSAKLNFQVWYLFVFRTIIQSGTLLSFWMLSYLYRKNFAWEIVWRPVQKDASGKIIAGGKFVRVRKGEKPELLKSHG